VPVDAPKGKEPRVAPSPKPTTDPDTIECAGCGSTIGINFAFCPKCGRQLDGAKGGRSWRPLSR
jgi:hypothetical protein